MKISLTVFWICAQCGARGEVETECADVNSLEAQLDALRDARQKINHGHPEQIQFGPTPTDGGWVN
jgi:hypothetical protein